MAKDVTVKVIRLDDPSKCRVDPDPFETEPGDTVTFEFTFPTDDGHVVFVGPTPFDADPETPGRFRQKRPHKVRDVTKPETFKYKVKWSEGRGNGDGQGQVTPG